MLCAIWYHSVQFKKREKCLWRSVTFSKVCSLLFSGDIFGYPLLMIRSEVHKRISKTLNYNNYSWLDCKRSSELRYYIKLCKCLVPGEKGDMALDNVNFALGIKCNEIGCVIWYKSFECLLLQLLHYFFHLFHYFKARKLCLLLLLMLFFLFFSFSR